VITIFEVVKPGLLTTIQDLGRKGYQKYGLAVSGAVDPYAHRIANILVSNPENEATLEVTLMGLQLKVLEDRVIAITGGNLEPYINDHPAPMWTSFLVKKGDMILFKGYSTGCRAYIAVSGGIKADVVLGSKSTDLLSGIGGIGGRALKKRDIIETGDTKAKVMIRKRLPFNLIPSYSENIKVRVILGPQEDAFTEEGIDTLLSSEYIVSKHSDRMACRLDGPPIEHVTSADILSEGMFLGAIQVPKNGLPILFQAGRQSVGGYTKIGGVISVDLPKVAQLKPNDRITFERITLTEAHQLLRKQESIFQILKASSY
jgi:antagonist of KipI